MIVERIALGLLIAFAALMGVNLLSAADRFTVAQKAYDELTFELEQFEYTNPTEPVRIRLRITNPVDQEIEVIAFELRILANGHSVGGAQVRPGELVPEDSSRSFRIEGSLDDVSFMQDIPPDSTIRWLVIARAQVRVDDALDPVWIDFSFRAETMAR